MAFVDLLFGRRLASREQDSLKLGWFSAAPAMGLAGLAVLRSQSGADRPNSAGRGEPDPGRLGDGAARRLAADFIIVLPADHRRLSQQWRSLHGFAREPGAQREPARGGFADGRLYPERGGGNFR